MEPRAIPFHLIAPQGAGPRRDPGEDLRFVIRAGHDGGARRGRSGLLDTATELQAR